MRNITIALISISVLSFVLAIIATLLGGGFLSVSAEAFSRTCSNLALIAIALILWFRLKDQ